MSKGSSPRPLSISLAQYEREHDRIFRKPCIAANTDAGGQTTKKIAPIVQDKTLNLRAEAQKIAALDTIEKVELTLRVIGRHYYNQGYDAGQKAK